VLRHQAMHPYEVTYFHLKMLMCLFVPNSNQADC
jgi:hypothetical protein